MKFELSGPNSQEPIVRFGGYITHENGRDEYVLTINGRPAMRFYPSASGDLIKALYVMGNKHHYIRSNGGNAVYFDTAGKGMFL